MQSNPIINFICQALICINILQLNFNGLFRRCAWVFEIKDYTHKGLAKIFKRQLAKNSWTLASNVNREPVLANNKEIIQDGGGGTDKLAFFAKLEYGNSKFLETVHATSDKPVLHDSVITSTMIDAALIEMRKSMEDHMIIDDPPWVCMYNSNPSS